MAWAGRPRSTAGGSRGRPAYRPDLKVGLSNLRDRCAGAAWRNGATERQPAVAGRAALMRRAILVSFTTCFVPLSAAAQWGPAATPVMQGPMTIEAIHSGFLAAPDVK